MWKRIFGYKYKDVIAALFYLSCLFYLPVLVYTLFRLFTGLLSPENTSESKSYVRTIEEALFITKNSVEFACKRPRCALSFSIALFLYRTAFLLEKVLNKHTSLFAGVEELLHLSELLSKAEANREAAADLSQYFVDRCGSLSLNQAYFLKTTHSEKDCERIRKVLGFSELHYFEQTANEDRFLTYFCQSFAAPTLVPATLVDKDGASCAFVEMDAGFFALLNNTEALVVPHNLVRKGFVRLTEPAYGRTCFLQSALFLGVYSAFFYTETKDKVEGQDFYKVVKHTVSYTFSVENGYLVLREELRSDRFDEHCSYKVSSKDRNKALDPEVYEGTFEYGCEDHFYILNLRLDVKVVFFCVEKTEDKVDRL